MKIALTGASGFVGMHLRRRFKDHVVIDRNDSVEAIVKKLHGVDALVNLAGAPIIKRWSDPYKEVLRRSRIDMTRKVVEALGRSQVRRFVSTSAIGIYPDDVACDERSAETADDFLGSLAREWEAEALKCDKSTAIVRLGVVLGREGGALAQMMTPFRFCVGGPIGNGEMMTSWIDIEDLMRLYAWMFEREEISGVYNAVAPNPVTNYTLSKALNRLYGCPFMIPVPLWALRLMYGEAAGVLSASKSVAPARLLDEGFTFAFPTVEASLRHIIEGTA